MSDWELLPPESAVEVYSQNAASVAADSGFPPQDPDFDPEASKDLFRSLGMKWASGYANAFGAAVTLLSSPTQIQAEYDRFQTEKAYSDTLAIDPDYAWQVALDTSQSTGVSPATVLTRLGQSHLAYGSAETLAASSMESVPDPGAIAAGNLTVGGLEGNFTQEDRGDPNLRVIGSATRWLPPSGIALTGTDEQPVLAAPGGVADLSLDPGIAFDAMKSRLDWNDRYASRFTYTELSADEKQGKFDAAYDSLQNPSSWVGGLNYNSDVAGVGIFTRRDRKGNEGNQQFKVIKGRFGKVLTDGEDGLKDTLETTIREMLIDNYESKGIREVTSTLMDSIVEGTCKSEASPDGTLRFVYTLADLIREGVPYTNKGSKGMTRSVPVSQYGRWVFFGRGAIESQRPMVFMGRSGKLVRTRLISAAPARNIFILSPTQLETLGQSMGKAIAKKLSLG